MKSTVGRYDSYTLISTVDPEQYDSLFADFSELKWYAINPPCTDGWGTSLMITYANGEYECIGVFGTYLSEEPNSFYGGSGLKVDDWNEFLAKYGVPPAVFY